jgi:hypothetical protein
MNSDHARFAGFFPALPVLACRLQATQMETAARFLATRLPRVWTNPALRLCADALIFYYSLSVLAFLLQRRPRLAWDSIGNVKGVSRS